MPSVRLNRMVCDNPEEGDADGDEVHFSFYADGVEIGRYPDAPAVIDHLHATDIRNTSDTFNFRRTADIRLYENDPGDNPDDLLGTLHIDTSMAGNHDGVFEMSGVRYVLNYDVF